MGPSPEKIKINLLFLIDGRMGRQNRPKVWRRGPRCVGLQEHVGENKIILPEVRGPNLPFVIDTRVGVQKRT